MLAPLHMTSPTFCEFPMVRVADLYLTFLQVEFFVDLPALGWDLTRGAALSPSMRIKPE